MLTSVISRVEFERQGGKKEQQPCKNTDSGAVITLANALLKAPGDGKAISEFVSRPVS